MPPLPARPRTTRPKPVPDPRGRWREWVLILCLPALLTAASVPEAGSDTALAHAQTALEAAFLSYADGDHARAAAQAREVGRRLYAWEPADEAGERMQALLISRLSLLTVRLNRLLYEISPVLEPERFTLPIPYNARIEHQIDRFLTVGREEFARWLSRSGRYLPLLRQYFLEEGLPEDLVYMALIESGFNPRNRSHKEAVGLFQFLMSTGEMVGLKSDPWVDERRDPGKAAAAAVRHLQDLYREFGDWDLVLAAYNAGSHRLKEAIRDQGTRDYWQLVLPPETEAYVPRFYAALVICREPDLYGFSPVLESAESADVVEVPGAVDLKVIADCAGVTLTALSDLNPELTKGCTPPEEAGYPLRLPPGAAERFRAAFAALPDAQKFLSPEEISRRKFKGVYHIYVVRSGESLYTIARKHHTTVDKLHTWNPVTKKKKYIHPGMKLRIYRMT